MSTIIELDALDTLFFRDGKPFSMGEDTWAEGLFPPPPSVIYGALRTAYFSENINNLAAAKTENDPTKELRIDNIYLKLGTIPFFPLPLDCVKETRNNNEDTYHVLTPLKATSLVRSTTEMEYILMPPSEMDQERSVENIEHGFLDKSELIDYLSAESICTVMTKDDFWVNETKIGIGRNNATGTSSDSGMLYRVNMTRLGTDNSLSIMVEFSGLELSNLKLLKLGGEGKAVACRKAEFRGMRVPIPLKKDGTYFKIYLATPAIFKQARFPIIDGITILAAAVGKPIPIGGFDVKERFPKPMQYAVPAGSVYYCKGNLQHAIETIHGKAISEERANEGFGIAYIGTFNMEEV